MWYNSLFLPGSNGSLPGCFKFLLHPYYCSQFRSQEEKKAAAVRVAAEQKKLAEILKDGLVIRMESKKQVLIGKGYPDESLSEEVSIIVLADLQEKQMSETNAMTSILAEQVRFANIFGSTDI